MVRSVLPAQDRFQPLYIHPGPVAVHQCLNHLLHLRAFLKQEVSAVLQLIRRILVAESASFPFLAIQCETQAGFVDPAVADRGQSPYNRLCGQGLCNRHECFYI